MFDTLFSMSGKVCVVTGGSSGLGSYAAPQPFSKPGQSAFTSLPAPRKSCKPRRKNFLLWQLVSVVAIVGDLATMPGVEALASQLAEREQHIDVLVNNAGLGTGGAFDKMSVVDWDRTMDINTRSPLFLTHALLGLLKARATVDAPSSVIFISSVAASEVFAHVMAYSTSKKAVEHLTPQIALALADDHIRVESIAPGRFSEMHYGRIVAGSGGGVLQSGIAAAASPSLRRYSRYRRSRHHALQSGWRLFHWRSVECGRWPSAASLTPPRFQGRLASANRQVRFAKSEKRQCS